jgi:hypothetical protein
VRGLGTAGEETFVIFMLDVEYLNCIVKGLSLRKHDAGFQMAATRNKIRCPNKIEDREAWMPLAAEKV